MFPVITNLIKAIRIVAATHQVTHLEPPRSPFATLAELQTHLASLQASQFGEVWLSGHGDSSLCLLKTSDRALLMFLRDPGDVGFTSRADDAFSTCTSDLEFELSNGQRDSHPAAWTVPFTAAAQALEFYFTNGERAVHIRWHDDNQSN